MITRAFITHKLAENFADCQDRFGVNIDTKSIAVSDGMGSTWQQKIWANILVATFKESNDWLPTHDAIKPLCSIWREEVTSYIEKLKEKNAPPNIIFRNERSLAEGRSAGATFVGIRFNGNEWNGSVLGDSCLIEWNGIDAKFHTSQEVDSFDSYPDYFDSDETKEGKGTPKNISGKLDSGSYLFLVSDPFSDFLLEHNKQGDIADYIKKLLDISSHDDFETLVEDWRKAGMHNDDTTLVIVKNDGSDNFSTLEIDDINVLIEKEKEIQKSKEVEPELEEEKEIEAESEGEKEETEIGIESEENVPTEKARQDVEECPSPSNEQNILPQLVDSEIFVEEFLTEYKNALEGRCTGKSQKVIKKFFGKLQYKTTQTAAKEALRTILDKYVIYAK